MKVVIVGNSGSGKTWLARQIAAGESVPIVHLDELFWEPGGFDRKRSRDEVGRLIEDKKSTSSWIVEGVFGELAERFLPYAETFIWLDLDWSLCRQRLEQRGSESKAHMDREQSAAGTAKLIEWASAYSSRGDGRSFEGHKKLFDHFKSARIHIRSEMEVNVFLNSVRRNK